jgi:two-component system nitrogen regulation response regulator NtrX
LKRVAPTGSRVLITGPAGVGKEVAARLLHSWSTRASSSFIVASAARMTPERVEEALFGIEKSDSEVIPGLLERAHGGTLFLDEIADMPVTTQGRILRVLTDQAFTRVGGSRTVRVDVRVVSATSRNLQEEMAAGPVPRGFLLQAERGAGAHSAAVRTARRHCVARPALPRAAGAFERYGIAPDIAPEALIALQSFDWPGNVRQLRNVIEQTLILAPIDRLQRIELDMLPLKSVAIRCHV